VSVVKTIIMIATNVDREGTQT